MSDGLMLEGYAVLPVRNAELDYINLFMWIIKVDTWTDSDEQHCRVGLDKVCKEYEK